MREVNIGDAVIVHTTLGGQWRQLSALITTVWVSEKNVYPSISAIVVANDGGDAAIYMPRNIEHQSCRISGHWWDFPDADHDGHDPDA